MIFRPITLKLSATHAFNRIVLRVKFSLTSYEELLLALVCHELSVLFTRINPFYEMAGGLSCFEDMPHLATS